MVSIDELFYGTGVSGLTEIERLQKKYNDFADGVTVFKVGMNPLFMPVPSWWQGDFTQKGWTPAWQIPHRHSGNPYTNDEALEYLNIAEKAYQLKLAWRTAQCESEGQRGVYCSYVSDIQGTLSGIHVLQNAVRIAKEQNLQHGVVGFDPNFKTFEILPEVFAEEDPSINSGLNGNEQGSQIINYPQSANVRISFTSNIGMFSSSIPINDISELQILSNESNEWRYTLIGSSTNQPLMTLNGLINKINNQIASVVIPPEEEEVYVFSQCVDVYRMGVAKSVYSVRETIDYETLSDYTGQGLLVRECGQSVPSDQEVRDFYGVSAPVDPETCLCGIKEHTGATECKECPPTEPGQVNWIPEPFFSFINNVFRR